MKGWLYRESVPRLLVDFTLADFSTDVDLSRTRRMTYYGPSIHHHLEIFEAEIEPKLQDQSDTQRRADIPNPSGHLVGVTWCETTTRGGWCIRLQVPGIFVEVEFFVLFSLCAKVSLRLHLFRDMTVDSQGKKTASVGRQGARKTGGSWRSGGMGVQVGGEGRGARDQRQGTPGDGRAREQA